MYYLVSDGGSKGNPGPSACAWGLHDDDKWIFIDSMYLGNGTNNNAEYHGLIYGLLSIRHSNVNELTIISDSELMIKQLQGKYEVKSDTLRPLYSQVKQVLSWWQIPITIEHHPRTHVYIVDIDAEYNKRMKAHIVKL